jgi:hypothetical protein
MKALPNRWVIDAKFTRLTLVSQWPIMLHEWLVRDLGPGPQASSLEWLRAAISNTVRSLLATALFCVIEIGVLYGIIWSLSWFEQSEFTLWLALTLFAIGNGSVGFSAMMGKPIGLFWLAAQLERPVELKERR